GYALATAPGVSWIVQALAGAAPLAAGVGLGVMLRERARRRDSQRLLDLQSEEIIYSNNELEKKFRDLETKIEQLSLLIDLSADVAASPTPLHLATVRALDVRAFVAVPLRVKDRIFGVLTVASSEPNRFATGDLELMSAVANHVALAVDRAESFQMIEELTRGLEDKLRVRTEQLR